MSSKIWHKLDEKIVVSNKFWTYKLDNYLISETKKSEYHYVHTEGSTLIIPVTSEGKIILVEQYRYLNKRTGLEFPCGLREKNLSAEENAIKELREETGFGAGKIRPLTEFVPYVGVSDEICEVFLATDLFPFPLPPDESEKFELYYFGFDELKSEILNNRIWDGMTLAAWALTEKKLEDFITNPRES